MLLMKECGELGICKPCLQNDPYVNREDVCTAVSNTVVLAETAGTTPDQIRNSLIDELGIVTTEEYVSVRMLEAASASLDYVLQRRINN